MKRIILGGIFIFVSIVLYADENKINISAGTSLNDQYSNFKTIDLPRYDIPDQYYKIKDYHKTKNGNYDNNNYIYLFSIDDFGLFGNKFALPSFSLRFTKHEKDNNLLNSTAILYNINTNEWLYGFNFYFIEFNPMGKISIYTGIKSGLIFSKYETKNNSDIQNNIFIPIEISLGTTYIYKNLFLKYYLTLTGQIKNNVKYLYWDQYLSAGVSF